MKDQARVGVIGGGVVCVSTLYHLAKKGMTEDEVREALGQPNLYNIKEYEDKNVTAWYYPTNEQGAAAAVFFRPRQGTLKVYNTDFDAVPGRGNGE